MFLCFSNSKYILKENILTDNTLQEIVLQEISLEVMSIDRVTSRGVIKSLFLMIKELDFR